MVTSEMILAIVIMLLSILSFVISYRQSAIAFCLVGISFFLIGIDIFIGSKWMIYVVLIFSLILIIYAIASSVNIERKRK